MIDALHGTPSHAAALFSPRVPKFEPHSWRIGRANFEHGFLMERARSLEALLNALIAGARRARRTQRTRRTRRTRNAAQP